MLLGLTEPRPTIALIVLFNQALLFTAAPAAGLCYFRESKRKSTFDSLSAIKNTFVPYGVVWGALPPPSADGSPSRAAFEKSTLYPA